MLTCVEELVASFNSSCASTLDLIAPLRSRNHKFKSQTWLNDSEGQDRKAERIWKRDRSHISLEISKAKLAGCATADYFVGLTKKSAQTFFFIENHKLSFES